MLRASMAAKFACAEQESDAAAQMADELLAVQNRFHEAVEANEEKEKQMNELFDIYCDLREQRNLELEALETELERLGLVLELMPPQNPPKKNAWMKKKKVKFKPYQLLTEGKFKISLR